MLNKIDAQIRRIIKDPDLLLDADAIEERKVAPSLTGVLYVFLSFLFLAIVWASLAKVDEVIVAKGRLVTVEPTVVLQPLETGIVKSLNVQVGQEVTRDQLLAELDPTLVGADYISAKERLETLEAQVARLEAEAAGKPMTNLKNKHLQIQRRIIDDKLVAYQSKVKSLELNLVKAREVSELLNRSAKNLSAKFESAFEAEAMSAKMFSGNFISRKEYLDGLDKKLDVEKDLISVQNQAVEANARVMTLQQELQIFRREYNQKLLEELVAVRGDRDRLAQEVRKVNLRNGLLELRAPMDGVVLDIASRSVGSVVASGVTFITLAPKDSALNVHAYVQPSDINMINVGDEAKVKIDSYPFQKYGLLKGRVMRVTKDAVRPDFRGLPPDKDYYVVVMNFDNLENKQHLDKMRLLPGMTLNSEIVIGNRAIISYILAPIVKIRDESMNEKN
jgi:hemolysin D